LGTIAQTLAKSGFSQVRAAGRAARRYPTRAPAAPLPYLVIVLCLLIVVIGYQARLRREQVQAALRQMHAAAEALPLNFKGILGGQLRAIEGLQAVDALTAAQTQYLESVIDYNRAQFALLRALGNPLDPQTVPQAENPGESK
jgi:hypothetical protein